MSTHHEKPLYKPAFANKDAWVMGDQQKKTMNRKERDLANHQFTGLVEHSHHLLKCSACGEDLLDVMVTEPKIEEEWQYRADCPHCGDHSFLTARIKGGTYIGHTSKTVYTGADIEGDKVYLRTAKGTTSE